MSFFLAGIDNKSASLEERERFFVPESGLPQALASFFKTCPLKGAVILSTCKRTEVYAESDRLPRLKGLVYEKQGLAAVEHLFRVAAGLDSEIVGESEVLGQVRRAYLAAREAGVVSPFVSAVFERALFAAKLVRQRFDPLKRDPSIAGAAVAMAQKLGLGLEGKKIFVLGAGAVAGVVAEECVARGASCVFVANRTFARAVDLAVKLKVRAIGFDAFYGQLDEADIIFCATASKHFVLKKDVLRQKRRKDKDVLIFDLAMPRDVEPEIRNLAGVRLFDLDQISGISPYSRSAVEAAEAFVKEKAQVFFERNRWRSGSAYGQAHWPESRLLKPCLS